MKKVMLLVITLWLLCTANAVAAQAPDLVIHVIDIEGEPAVVGEIGCAYGTEEQFYAYQEHYCTQCSSYTCTFGVSVSASGGYISGSVDGYTAVPEGSWHITQGEQVAVLWNRFPWDYTHYVTFTLTTVPPTPTPLPTTTPIPTLTPIPTMEPPSSVDFTVGFGPTFQESYGALSGYGIIPDFGLDHTQWLFAGRKWIQFLNQGNLLYVMGGILMAIMVLRWAIDRLKNPR